MSEFSKTETGFQQFRKEMESTIQQAEHKFENKLSEISAKIDHIEKAQIELEQITKFRQDKGIILGK